MKNVAVFDSNRNLALDFIHDPLPLEIVELVLDFEHNDVTCWLDHGILKQSIEIPFDKDYSVRFSNFFDLVEARCRRALIDCGYSAPVYHELICNSLDEISNHLEDYGRIEFMEALQSCPKIKNCAGSLRKVFSDLNNADQDKADFAFHFTILVWCECIVILREALIDS